MGETKYSWTDRYVIETIDDESKPLYNQEIAERLNAAHNGGLVEALRVLWALTVEVRSYAGGLEGLAHAHGADLSAGKALGERIDAWYAANRAALTALESQ